MSMHCTISSSPGFFLNRGITAVSVMMTKNSMQTENNQCRYCYRYRYFYRYLYRYISLQVYMYMGMCVKIIYHNKVGSFRVPSL